MSKKQHQQFNVGVKALIRQDQKVLVLRVAGQDFWELPGGRIDEGETIEAALRRELREELGQHHIAVQRVVHAQIGQYPLADSLRLLLVMFCVRLSEPGRLALSSEHTALCWIGAHELDGLSMPLPDQAAIRKLLA